METSLQAANRSINKAASGSHAWPGCDRTKLYWWPPAHPLKSGKRTLQETEDYRVDHRPTLWSQARGHCRRQRTTELTTGPPSEVSKRWPPAHPLKSACFDHRPTLWSQQEVTTGPPSEVSKRTLQETEATTEWVPMLICPCCVFFPCSLHIQQRQRPPPFWEAVQSLRRE